MDNIYIFILFTLEIFKFCSIIKLSSTKKVVKSSRYYRYEEVVFTVQNDPNALCFYPRLIVTTVKMEGIIISITFQSKRQDASKVFSPKYLNN